MAFTPSQATVRQPRQNGIYDENVLLRVIDVDAARQVLNGEVIPTTSSTLPAQQIQVCMDLKAISTPERERLGQKARGSWFGGKIDQRTANQCRQAPLIVAQSARTDPTKPGILFARWLVSMGREDRILHGRASLITTLEQEYVDGPQVAKVKRIRLWMPNLMDLANPRHVESVRQRLGQGARNSQAPRDTVDPATRKPVIGSSLRRYAFSLVALCPETGCVLERTPVISSYIPEGEYPSYVPEPLRYYERQGERLPRPIPVDETFFDGAARGFQAYLQEQGYTLDTQVAIALACDLIPAQESGMQTYRPYSPSSGERYAKVHQAGEAAWPMTPHENSQVEINVGVTDVILALSPQQNSVNDYVNQAIVSYPLEGSFLHYLTWRKQLLDIPSSMNQPREMPS